MKPQGADRGSAGSARHADTPGYQDTLAASGGLPQVAPQLPQIEGYEVLEEIGRGAMGAVYRARQLATGGRVVALKVMLGEAFARPADLRRFEREVEIASELNHPNIARIYDSGLTHDRHYFAMEYVAGEHLDQYCALRRLPLPDRLRLFCGVCEAVAFAHRHGVIHRDLKPSNIMVDADGLPHILDFGLAKTQAGAGDVAESRPELTMDGTLLGTLPYMAPEQAECRTRAIDTRTDVYALGVILYELLTGKYPYEVTGRIADVLKRIAEEAPRRPSTVNRLIGDEVETIVLRALHKEPDRRYAGADDLARDVLRFLAGEPIDAKRDSGWYVLRKTVRRYRVPVAAVAAVVLLIAVAALVSFTLYRRAEASRREALDAKVEAEQQRAAAQASAAESLQRLARQYFSEGIVWWFDRQDAAAASAYFAEALRVSPEPYPAARMALHNSWMQCWEILVPPLAPTNADSALAFDPERERAVMRLRDSKAQVWDLTTRQPVSPPLPHEDRLDGAALSADGRWLVTTYVAWVGRTANHMAQVWEVTTGRPVGPPIRSTSCTFSPDGTKLLISSTTASMPVYGHTTGKLISGTIRQTNGTVQVWDLATGRPVPTPLQLGGSIRTAMFSPDGMRVLTAAQDDTACIWDIATGQAVTPVLQASAAAFGPHGNWVVTLSSRGRRQLWDAATGQPVTSHWLNADGTSAPLFSPDGKRVMLSSRDETARVWDVATGKPISPLIHNPPDFDGARFSPDGERLLLGSRDLRIWDAASGEPVSPPLNHAGGAIREATFSSDSRCLFVVPYGGMVREWGAPEGPLRSATMQHEGSSVEAVPSLNGQWVATTSGEEAERVCRELYGPSITRENAEQHAGERLVAYSRDGKKLITESTRATTRIRDASTGEPISAPMPHPVRVSGARFSPDGRRVVTMSYDGTARVWDAATGRPVSAHMQHGSRVGYADFSPDGRRVVTASDDRTARVWDAATGQPVSGPMRHDGIQTAAFSRDGKWIVTAGGSTARVWDAVTGQPVSAPMQHPAAMVKGAVFSPDSRRVVVAYALGTPRPSARVWFVADVNWDEPIDLIQARVRARLGVEVAATGEVEPLSEKELAAAWTDYERLRADYERSHHRGTESGGRPTGVREQEKASAVVVAEHSFTCAISNGAVTIADYTGPGGHIAIPGAIRGLPVTGIADRAFYRGANATYVEIPAGVTRIGSRAFSWCTGLTDVAVPGSVTNIGPSAFDNCASLGRVTIPDGVIDIGDKAFNHCTSLAELIIPNSVQHVGYQAFRQCYKLTHVAISAGVTSIEGNPFVSCGRLQAIVVDPANPAYSSTGDGVLLDKARNVLVAYPGGREGDYDIPDGIAGIGPFAFACCSRLGRVTVPSTVTNIGDHAFSQCRNLRVVRFEGDAPHLAEPRAPEEDTPSPLGSGDVFAGLEDATAYYRTGTEGWGKEFGGLPTAVWLSEESSISASTGTADVQTR